MNYVQARTLLDARLKEIQKEHATEKENAPETKSVSKLLGVRASAFINKGGHFDTEFDTYVSEWGTGCETDMMIAFHSAYRKFEKFYADDEIDIELTKDSYYKTPIYRIMSKDGKDLWEVHLTCQRLSIQVKKTKKEK